MTVLAIVTLLMGIVWLVGTAKNAVTENGLTFWHIPLMLASVAQIVFCSLYFYMQ